MKDKRTIWLIGAPQASFFGILLPCGYIVNYIPGIPRRIHVGCIVKIEIISNPVEGIFLKRVKILIRLEGPDIDHSKGSWCLKVRTEAIQPDRSTCCGRSEKTNRAQELQHLGIILPRLSGEAIQDVPFCNDIILPAPFEKLNVF